MRSLIIAFSAISLCVSAATFGATFTATATPCTMPSIVTHPSFVTIIPGTDNLSGYMLHHELQLYVRAGIPAADVLRMATLTPALVMGVDKDRGAISAGKLADMILVDGDPIAHIADIEKVDTVIKGGKVYEPAKIEAALGIAPRATH